MKKKILFVASVFLPEPVVSATLVSNLADELSKYYDITVLRPVPTRPMGFKMPNYNDSDYKYKVITINSYTCPKSSIIGRLRECYSYGKAAAKYISTHANDIDLVYNAAWPLFGALFVSRAAKKYGIPYIATVQDLYPESISSKLPSFKILIKTINKALIPIDKENLDNAIRIHTISSKMADYLSLTRNLPKDKIFVINNWQDESLFNSPKLVSENSNSIFTFMYLGNIGPLAGIHTLIDAVNILKDLSMSFRLVIAGSGSTKENLISKVRDLDIKNVEFWEVPAGEVANTQNKADVMILPIMKGFSYSSIPSKLPAYMFSARPILACVDKGSDTSHSIIKADCGWTIMPEDSVLLAQTMKNIMTYDRKTLSDMGLKGRLFALENFSKSSNVKKFTNEFIKILK